MSKIESALAFDFARRGMVVIPLVFACMIVIPLWILTMLGADGVLGPNTSEGVKLHISLTLVTGFVAAVAVIHAQGRLTRFYVRPISAARLVGWQLLLGTVTIALLYVASTAVLNLAGAGWPVIGPALFLATALACALAAIWSLEGSIVGQFLGCTATTIPLLGWLGRCYGADSLSDWEVMWRTPTAVEVLTLGAIGLGAYGWAVAGVARTRRGDLWDFSSLKAWWDRLCARGPAAQPFATPWAAQVWCEWREKLGLAPACIIGGLSVFGLIAWSLNWMPTEELPEFMVAMPTAILILLAPLLFGMLAGNCSKEGQTGMKHVLATRPVSNSFLAAVILRTCALGLTWAFVTWLIGLGLVSWLVYLSGYPGSFGNLFWPEKFDNFSPVLTAVSVPVISWTVTTCMACFFATGRPWLWVSVIFGLFGVGLIAYVLRILLTPQAYEILTILWLVLSGGACAAGTLWAFVSAARLRLVSNQTFAIAIAVWLALASGLIGIVGVGFPQVYLVVNVVGLLALAVLPFAALPLALRWNRHR